MRPTPLPPEIATRSLRRNLIVLTAITLVGLALRLTNVGESLWLDELHSGWVIHDAWSEVAWRSQIGNQSHLWFYAVKLVTALGGENEFTLRLLSLLTGTALIPATYWLVKPFFTNDSARGSAEIAGLLAAALVAVDYNCIFYATEARPYACLQLCAVVQLGVFWQLFQHPTNYWRLCWIATTTLAFYLHYTGGLLLLGELTVLVAFFCLSRRPTLYRPRHAVLDWLAVLLLCVPAVGHVLEIAQRRQMWDSMNELPELTELFTMFPLHATVAVGSLVGVIMLWQRLRNESHPQQQLTWAALATVGLWFLIPLLTAWAATHLQFARLFSGRYLIAFGIGPMLLTALLLASLPTARWQWCVAAGVLSFALYDSNIVAQLRYDGRAIGSRTEDWRGALAWLRAEYVQHPGLVLVDAGLVEDAAAEFAPQQLAERDLRYRCFPLLSIYNTGITPERVVPLSLYDQWRRQNPLSDEIWMVTRTRHRSSRRPPETKHWPVVEYKEFEGVYIELLTSSRPVPLLP